MEEELLATFRSGLGFGTGFPLQVVKDQIKVLISGTHSHRPWALPPCARLSVMRLNNGSGCGTIKEVGREMGEVGGCGASVGDAAR